MKRRNFLTSGAAATTMAAASATTSTPAAAQEGKHHFKLKYAPHPRMFKELGGDDVVDQIKFAADQGFTAWEDNRVRSYEPAEQERIGQALADNNMEMGVFVAHGSIGEVTFAKKDEAVWDKVLADIKDSVEVSRRVNAKWMTVVPGNVDEDPRSRLAEGYQFANVIELLRRCAEIFEPHELVMVLEPLNWYTNHGGVFLEGSPQAYAVCKAVNSPACKILFDIYHQQITEGNLINNIDLAWDEIAYIQIGDNPGRKEPGTGEINYRNVFRHIHSKGFDGILGMEHGNSIKGAEGEQAVIDAYVEADSFEPITA